MRAYLPLTMDQFYFFCNFLFLQFFLEFGLFLHFLAVLSFMCGLLGEGCFVVLIMSGIACRPTKYAGTCDLSSLALLFGQVLFGNIYAFFWQNVAIYVLFFCKNIDIYAIFWQNVAIYALFSWFRPNSQNYSQLRL